MCGIDFAVALRIRIVDCDCLPLWIRIRIFEYIWIRTVHFQVTIRILYKFTYFDKYIYIYAVLQIQIWIVDCHFYGPLDPDPDYRF